MTPEPTSRPAGAPEAAPSGRAITAGTAWNVAGFGLPAVVAIFATPPLVHGLGADRFGILTLGWMLMGYFGLFDLGMGRATTKALADAIDARAHRAVRDLFWSSTALHAALGAAGALLLAALVPFLVGRALTIPPALRGETSAAFLVLAASVPFIVIASSLRGSLEGFRRFDLVNAVKIPTGALVYVAPLLVLPFTNHLGPVIAAIAAVRVLTTGAYLLLCLPLLPGRPESRPRLSALFPFFRLGGWLLVSTLLVPVVVSLDRLAIGSRISAAAVGYYAAPYEAITRLWILSMSLLSVLFPTFSVLSARGSGQLALLYRRAVGILFGLAFPPVLAVLLFAGPLLGLWLGPEFARHASAPARWLAAGTLASVLGQVPLTLLQGAGRADVTGILQLVELPLYAIAAWAAAGTGRIEWVAAVWAARAFLEAVVLFVLAAPVARRRA